EDKHGPPSATRASPMRPRQLTSAAARCIQTRRRGASRAGAVGFKRAMPELIECDDCGRSFVTDDAAGMLAVIKGPCPSCGGTFRLALAVVGAPAQPGAAPRSTRS